MSIRYFYCYHMGLCGKVLRGSSNPLGFVICGYLNSADSLLTCVLLQLGEGGVHHPPQLCQCSHSQSLQPFTEGGSTIPPGGSTTPLPQLPRTGRGGSTTPPSSCRQTGRGGSTTPPRSFQRSGGKAPPPPTPHLAANLFKVLA